MTRASDNTTLDIFTDGLMRYGEAIGDKQGTLLLIKTLPRNVKDFVIENIKADNTCTFAFPSMVILPDIRTDCLVTILNDAIIIAWQKGFFKKTVHSRVISKDSIKQATWGISNQPGTRGAALLTILSDGKIDFSLPKNKLNLANAILAAVQTK
ncbi:MAG: hypothetical protein ACREHC_03725 [Candidatus Levyibacteriota bacterium]